MMLTTHLFYCRFANWLALYFHLPYVPEQACCGMTFTLTINKQCHLFVKMIKIKQDNISLINLFDLKK